jgi:DegV family protein with EDD domain
MPAIAIVTDTSSDLPKAAQERYGIITVPLTVRFDQDEHLDCDLALDEFWRRARQAPPYPATSQPSVGMFEKAFAQQVEQGKQVICMTVTSKHSGTFNSAYTAAQSFPGKVTVFDTLSLSLCQSYMAISAAKAAEEGRSVEEIMALLESLRSRTQFFLALDTIEFLRRGGRADRIMPILERVVRMLSIKPLLRFDEGELSPMGAARSRQKAMQRIRQEIAKFAPAEMLFVIHTRSPELATVLAQSLSDEMNFPREQMMVGETGPVLSCHGGPGIIAAAIVQRTS